MDEIDYMNEVYDHEEAHYVHTVNAFVSLIEKYGWSQVIEDLRTAMGNKTWQ